MKYLFFFAFYVVVYTHNGLAFALNLSMSTNSRSSNGTGMMHDINLNRRNALISASASILGITALPSQSLAELPRAETVDLAAIKAAQAKTASVPGISNSLKSGAAAILPFKDPPPLLTIRGGLNGKSSIKIPRIGYSLYKTAPDQAARCTSLALRAGVRHFDVGTLYNSNTEVAVPLKKYLDIGIDAVDFSNEKSELLTMLDSTKRSGDEHSLATFGSGLLSTVSPAPAGSAGRRGRREGLFISHKLSNAEQSTNRIDVRRAVKAQIAALGTQYLDMVSIHSPLTDKERRMETYAALLELRDAGFVKSVGVCNYGLAPLREIKESGLGLPSVNQLELSPFNTHDKIVSWCKDNGIAVTCGAWSKLSGADGPQDQWAIIAEIAKKKGMTKAQVLTRWSLQKGYICVPRSAASSKLERVAFAENSYGGVNPQGGNFILSDEEMLIIEGLNTDWKAGRLGRRDGWGDDDVIGVEWDPTDYF
jgi:diketogulonate reductase-like aldo/keto reductase